MIKTTGLKTAAYVMVGFLSIISGIFTGSQHHWMTALTLLCSAVTVYFFIVFFLANKNWMDIRAMFSAVWLGTLGLALLRLSGYQEQWQDKTWLLIAVGYVVFQVGANAGMYFIEKKSAVWRQKWQGHKFGKFSLKIHEERLFVICASGTLIGLLCFILNVLIKGYIPCFSHNPSAYIDFYTKFHVFAVAATILSPLCYYCIKTQKISKVKKAILWLCILYLLILFPIMVVSRGVFVVEAVAFTTTVFYLNKKRLRALICCVVLIMAVYMGTSELRSLADWQLNIIFEPVEITTNENDETNKPDTGLLNNQTQYLPPKLMFLYGYLTVSHDNFNEAVKYAEKYTWGTRQLVPFNVVFRQQWIDDILTDAESYQVNEYLNTINMLGIFYYDLRTIGIVIFMLLWSFVFGSIQSLHCVSKGPFSLLTLGVVMSPVTLCFFASWVDRFDLWMLCGVILIIAAISVVDVSYKKNKNK